MNDDVGEYTAECDWWGCEETIPFQDAFCNRHPDLNYGGGA